MSNQATAIILFNCIVLNKTVFFVLHLCDLQCLAGHHRSCYSFFNYLPVLAELYIPSAPNYGAAATPYPLLGWDVEIKQGFTEIHHEG